MRLEKEFLKKDLFGASNILIVLLHFEIDSRNALLISYLDLNYVPKEKVDDNNK